ncbi:hypothetical protein Selin_0982 [Desulfurispirillum indicum S5]|uniref:CO weal-nitrogenase n=1 Tax=Desulfurispirillum indicum (strain ATCC BAA-1389 / DSM 22839 / S5) TaxID=653733 RepID=E6W356_DESIS|nr:N(2)-fixation sustaining protein CowN [Desulfurispirillum indicum]ADU65717.1 hypothetical protein Selin_0982 [Desulfurispirillum indicum S5]
MNQAETESTIDRYATFKGIDCDGRAGILMQRIEKLAADPLAASPFWAYFLAKRTPRSGPKPDDLFLIHTNINQLYELFEQAEDEESLAMLEWLEEHCC